MSTTRPEACETSGAMSVLSGSPPAPAKSVHTHCRDESAKKSASSYSGGKLPPLLKTMPVAEEEPVPQSSPGTTCA